MADPRAPGPGGSDDITDKVQEDARRMAAQARDEVRQRAEQGSDQAASAIEDFADAIRRAQDELGRTHHTASARMVGEAAQGLEQLSRALARRSPEEMLGDLRGFGRDHPSAFLAGSVLAGMALGRMARSSAHHEHGAGASGAAATGHDPAGSASAGAEGSQRAGGAGAAVNGASATGASATGAGRGPLPPDAGRDTASDVPGRRTPAGSIHSPSPDSPSPTRKD